VPDVATEKQAVAPEVFYNDGLRFECTRCSRCCRHTAGYVFLSADDVDTLARAIGIERQELLRRYCRRISLGVAARISLKEKANLDCVFWENGGCSVYDARPLQCRSFPFWSACVSSAEEWELHSRQCPGIGNGALHSKGEIDRWLALRMREGFLEA
jgi:Fe-S-cluster containining protein